METSEVPSAIGEISFDRRFDPHFLYEFEGVAHANILKDFYRHDIPGMGQSIPEGDRPQVILIIVLGSPVGTAIVIRILDGRVHEDRRRSIAFFNGSGIDEGLEGGPGLPLRTRGAIELALAEIPASHHCLYISRFGIDTEQGALNHGVLFETEYGELILL